MREIAKLPILLKELRLSTMGHIWSSFAETAGKEGWSHPPLSFDIV